MADVSFHADAVLTHDPEVVDGDGIPLFGRAAIEVHRLYVVPGNAVASLIEAGEVALGLGVVLLGGLSFLILLTTQLQNQDPLAPMDSNEFTAQLVRFTQVEQAIAQNKNLENLAAVTQASQAAAAVSYLGTRVEATGDTNELTADGAEWTYTVPADTAETHILIRNAQGQIVFTGQGETSPGKQSYEWDGNAQNGTALPPGLYQISVTVVAEGGGSSVAKTGVLGTVTSVETVDGTYVLSLGQAKVPFDSVIAVSQG